MHCVLMLVFYVLFMLVSTDKPSVIMHQIDFGNGFWALDKLTRGQTIFSKIYFEVFSEYGSLSVGLIHYRVFRLIEN